MDASLLTTNQQRQLTRVTGDVVAFINNIVESRIGSMCETLSFVSDQLGRIGSAEDPAEMGAVAEALQEVVRVTLSENGDAARRSRKTAGREIDRTITTQRKKAAAHAAQAEQFDRMALAEWERECDRCRRLSLPLPPQPQR